MKKLFYVKCLLLIIVLSIFSATGSHSSSLKASSKKFGSCSAAYNLYASKNYTSITLTWRGSVPNYSYGGYYNYKDVNGYSRSQNFGASTGGTQVTISVPSSTYSITFKVNTICSDGTTTESAPGSFYF
jgi:hypothetical protein